MGFLLSFTSCTWPNPRHVYTSPGAEGEGRSASVQGLGSRKGAEMRMCREWICDSIRDLGPIPMQALLREWFHLRATLQTFQKLDLAIRGAQRVRVGLPGFI